MPLVSAALVPHPPLIIPSIGREHARLLEKTAAAFAHLNMSFAAAAPETFLVISPHLPIMPETFTVNHAPRYVTHFLEFGDFAPAREFSSDPLLIERIRREARDAGKKIITVSDGHLDYGSGVPLTLIPAHDSYPRVVIVSPTMGSAKEQFEFGRCIKEAVMKISRRVAVVCSGDLSHRLSSDTPNGFSARAKEFDELLLADLKAGSASPILQMNHELIEEAHSCGYSAICLLMGILDRVDYQPELLSYEAPFGVGYCTMEFHLK
jgi:aromatic ring-opening dioxygenase LigB subunit